MLNPTKFIEILKKDQNIVDSILNHMEQNGLLEHFDYMLGLLNDFTLELEVHTASLISPEKSMGTTRKVNWNDRLGLHMLCVVVSQYILRQGMVYQRARGMLGSKVTELISLRLIP